MRARVERRCRALTHVGHDKSLSVVIGVIGKPTGELGAVVDMIWHTVIFCYEENGS